MASMAIPIQTYTGATLTPLYGKKALEQAVNLLANTVYPMGTVLGPVTSSAADVQTITMAGTSGNWTISGVNPVTGVAFTTAAMAFNIPLSTTGTNLQAILNAAFAPGTNVVVTGTAGSSYVVTFGGDLTNMPIQLLTVGQGTLAGGAVSIAHTTTGRSVGTFAPYLTGNNDGSQIPKCALKYGCATDAGGNISLANVASGSEWGITRPETPAYFSGYFRGNDLVGLDSGALALTNAAFVLINGALGDSHCQVEIR